MHLGYFIPIIALLVACQNDTHHKEIMTLPHEADKQLLLEAPKPLTPPPYPWQDAHGSTIAPITKEYFRCRGSSLHSPRIVLEGTKELQRYYDCSGGEKHSLPLQDGKEHIYPILLELMNEIQNKTNSPVIITSGHRCPSHQNFIDSSPKAGGSKHQVGAAVSFYVEGLEAYPERILQIIFDYYKTHDRYEGKQEYISFSRYEKESDVTINPWYNKEVFIKLYKAQEGRDFDNRHPYAYLNVQVRFDRSKNEPVTVSYVKANQLLRK